jgi:hypothetical protein
MLKRFVNTTTPNAEVRLDFVVVADHPRRPAKPECRGGEGWKRQVKVQNISAVTNLPKRKRKGGCE